MTNKTTYEELGRVALAREMNRIRRVDDVKYLNLRHIEGLPNFGLFYLNLEQIISLVVADVALDGRWVLDEDRENFNRLSIEEQFKANEQVLNAFPREVDATTQASRKITGIATRCSHQKLRHICELS